MYRFVVVAAFALLFTAIAVRLAFGGLDTSLAVASAFAALLWWRLILHLRRWRARSGAR